MFNYFPVTVGVYSILSPKAIISNEKIHSKQHIGLNIGQYYQVHEHEGPRNSQLSQTKGAIIIGPIVN